MNIDQGSYTPQELEKMGLTLYEAFSNSRTYIHIPDNEWVYFELEKGRWKFGSKWKDSKPIPLWFGCME